MMTLESSLTQRLRSAPFCPKNILSLTGSGLGIVGGAWIVHIRNRGEETIAVACTRRPEHTEDTKTPHNGRAPPIRRGPYPKSPR